MILVDTACINRETGSKLRQQRDVSAHYYPYSLCVLLYKEEVGGHDLWLNQREETFLPVCVNPVCRNSSKANL